jgi:tellurite resistance protein
LSDVLNKKNFMSFSNQCRRAGVTAIDVERVEAGGEVRLKYHAREPRTRRVLNGEWIIARADGAVEAREKAFYELAEKQFAVTRREPA